MPLSLMQGDKMNEEFRTERSVSAAPESTTPHKMIEPLQPAADISRAKFLWILGAFFGAYLLYNVAFPDLHGLTADEKCEYVAHRIKNDFISEADCKVVQAIQRLEALAY
jgi:hypothetical protein